MRVVPAAVDPAAAGPAALEIGFIGVHGVHVRRHRVGPASHPHVDVRRHVHQVTGSGHHRGQLLSTGNRARRVPRLHGVDEQVARARVIRIQLDRAGEKVENHRSGGARGAVPVPVVPRREVHQGLGVERQHLGVVGIAVRHVLHRVGVGAVERGPVAVLGVAGREGGDECLFLRSPPGGATWARRTAASAGASADAAIGALTLGPEGERGAPGAHAAARIEPLRFAERFQRAGMIERPVEPEPLIEVLGRARSEGASPRIDTIPGSTGAGPRRPWSRHSRAGAREPGSGRPMARRRRQVLKRQGRPVSRDALPVSRYIAREISTTRQQE